MMEDCAVYIQNVDKYYGTIQILLNFNMKVMKGSIYGLLGSSGCGKTTLLNCIVGRRTIDSGRIWVLGGMPGDKASGMPGPRVGYMPQNIALVGEFSVKGAIYYFGHIFKMPKKKIEERYEFLKKLLELPPDHQMIKHCSGGQQRRVSFACAMVHEPELLILDEPTVGLDPVMRNSIWNHLIELAHKKNTAIIITTHYIEEVKQADVVGLMRDGRLLAEETPSKLLTSFGTDSLEEVFLCLSKQQSRASFSYKMEEHIQLNGDCKSIEILTEPKATKTAKREKYAVDKHHLKALMGKNYLQYLKNRPSLIFNFLFPIMDVLTFIIAVGGDARVDIGIVNNEYTLDVCNRYIRENTAIPQNYVDCDFKYLSCRFLDDIRDDTINKVYYDDVDSAMRDVTHGKIIGVMHFTNNFTGAFQKRTELVNKIDIETLDSSEIKVWLDMSNHQIGLAFKFKLLRKYLDFQKSLAEDCNLSSILVQMPLNIHYEYGNDKEPFIYFMVPGVILSMIFFLTTTMTSSIIIQDRLEGVWDRSIVAGVTSVEIVLTHLITQVLIICVQVAEVLIVVFGFYGIKYEGSMALIASIVFLQGVTGMVCGFWISIISETHNMANILTTGTFFPIFVLCGMLWPLEGQPVELRYISKFLPFTTAVESLRHVMKKGWKIEHFEVLTGIGVSLIWIVCLGILSIYLIKKKR